MPKPHVQQELDQGDANRLEPAIARELRRSATFEERLLWSKLRDRALGGWKFRRQQRFGRFVLDFYCADARLAVELDGGQHFSEAGLAADRERDEWLAAHGVRMLRFENVAVRERLDELLQVIQAAAAAARRGEPE